MSNKIRAVERSYPRAASRMTLVDGMRNEDIYKGFEMAKMADGVNCGVVE